ncbi:hypothetical protein D3C75_297340 [compost metagenome]
MSQSPRALSAQDSPLTFYTLHNYSGTPTPVSHGQTGIIASSVTAWAQLSLSVGTGSLRAWIWSSVNTGDPAQSYTGHAESYVSANISELDHAYSSPQFPLQYLGLDSALASPVIVAFSGTFSGPDAFAATALVPGGTSQTTFASASTPGALGFVGTTAGQSTFVNLLTGTQNTDGTVAWSGSGSLTLVWDGAQLQVTGATGLPDSWTFATPVRQADGSWQVSLTEGAVTHTGTLYSGANYTGSSQTLKAHQFLTVNSGAGWTALSARLSELPVLLYASFNALDVSYHYSTYQLLRLTQDTPDFSVPFTGNTPVQMLVTDPGDVQVNVQVGTTGTSDAVLVMSQAYPQPFSTAATRSAPGLLALVPAAGTPQTIAVQYGSLNGDGTASLTGSGTLTVGLNGAAPVVTPGTGIPAEWVFGTPVPQADGSWQVALSDVPVTGSLTLYPQKNYEGTPVAQNEHQVATLRTLAYHWTYDSVKVNGERFLSHTVYDPLDVNYDWQRYRDNYRADDIPDISLDYELTSPLIQGVTLGENDVVVQVLVIPQDTDVPVVLSATQVWPEMYATASVTNGLQTHEGVMVVFDRSTPVKVPLQVGTLDEAGHVKWQGSTSVTAGWDETAQRPVLVLDPDTTPEDWQLWPLNATDQPGLWRTELSGSVRATPLKVMGARTEVGVQGYAYNQQTLVALDPDTLQPVVAQWQYAGEEAVVTTDRFPDTRPGKRLTVSRGGVFSPAVTLSESNIVGDGYNNSEGHYDALAARLDDGTVTAWGYASSGGTPPVDPANHDVVQLVASGRAFAAVNADGQVMAWGDASYGGSVPSSISGLTDIVSVAGAYFALAALRATGEVVAWGDSRYGGSVPPDITGLTDIVSVAGAYYALAALRATGEVVAWGDTASGGSVPSSITDLTDIVSVTGNGGAFAALRATGEVVAWGDSRYGGSVPSAITGLKDIVSIAPGGYTFAALRATGEVVAWGDTSQGGSVPPDITDLNDIVSVTGNGRAFAALRATGEVVAWGDSRYGGTVPPDITDLNDIVSVTGNVYAFAALRAAGEVVAWGDADYGGSIPADIAAQLTGVRAVYASGYSFCALKDDNTVVVWGISYAGSMANVPATLQGNIAYEVAPDA